MIMSAPIIPDTPPSKTFNKMPTITANTVAPKKLVFFNLQHDQANRMSMTVTIAANPRYGRIELIPV
jgi:hypothetical protein